MRCARRNRLNNEGTLEYRAFSLMLIHINSRHIKTSRDQTCLLVRSLRTLSYPGCGLKPVRDTSPELSSTPRAGFV